MKVTLDHVDDLTADIKMLWFKPEKPIRYIAGQFTELKLPHEGVDERGDKRWFTLSSSPSEPLLAITTRNSHDKASSFKKQLFSLKPGVELNFAEPMGDFVLPKDRTIPLVFVAGGIGITPMRSMIKWLIDTNDKRDIRLLYGVRHESDAVFVHLFKEYGVTVQVTAEHLTADRIGSFADKLPGKLIFLSGPEPMTETLVKDLQNLGISNKRLVTDYFPGYDAF